MPTRPPIATPAAIAAHGPYAVAQQHGGDDAGQGDRRSDRQVDAAGDDDHRHADGAERDDDRLGQHDAQVAHRQVLIGRVAHQREDADDQQQADERRQRDQQAADSANRTACHPPMAASITDSGVQSAIGRTGVSRPRHMTASEWQTPNSSGRYELTITTPAPREARSTMAR